MELMTILIPAFAFILIFLLVNLIKQKLEIEDLKVQKVIAVNEVKILSNMYRNQISVLQGQIDSLLRVKTINNPNISEDVIQAVKYAMKHAHPDNGGNSDDFMKFKRCYEELTRK